LTMN